MSSSKSQQIKQSQLDPPRRRYAVHNDDMGLFSIMPTMFDPNSWALEDEIVNFEDILREEKCSSRVAKKQDDEALSEMLEEERREQLTRAVKKRKQSVTYGVGLVQPSTESPRKSSRLRKLGRAHGEGYS